MSYYTYVFFDPTRNNEPFYVGQGTKSRIYKKKNKQVESRRKKIIENNKILTVDIIPALNQNHSKFLEICLIERYGTRPVVEGVKRGPLWNFTKGGEGTCGITPWNKGKNIKSTRSNYFHSEETKQKISIANKGQKREPQSEETKNKISISKIGKNRTEETKKKISKKLAGKCYRETGPLTDEHKLNISKSTKGKPWSEARRLAQQKKDNICLVDI